MVKPMYGWSKEYFQRTLVTHDVVKTWMFTYWAKRCSLLFLKYQGWCSEPLMPQPGQGLLLEDPVAPQLHLEMSAEQ